jgi:hypothetical protein
MKFLVTGVEFTYLHNEDYFDEINENNEKTETEIADWVLQLRILEEEGVEIDLCEEDIDVLIKDLEDGGYSLADKVTDVTAEYINWISDNHLPRLKALKKAIYRNKQIDEILN